MAGCPPFSWLNNIPLYIFQKVYSSVDGQLGCFHIWAVVNNASINMGGHIFLQNSVFISFGYIPKGKIAGSCGRAF